MKSKRIQKESSDEIKTTEQNRKPIPQPKKNVHIEQVNEKEWEWASEAASQNNKKTTAAAHVKSEMKTHGFGDQFLRSLYNDPELMDAAFEMEPFSKPHQLFGHLSKPTVSDHVARRFPIKAGDHFSEKISQLTERQASKPKIQEGLLRTVEGMKMDDIQVAYELRFDHELLHDGDQHSSHVDQAGWDKTVVANLWEQLSVLPDSDVVHNSEIDQMIAKEGGGGWHNSYYDVIAIGISAYPDTMAATIRHEVGHAVHDQKRAEIDAWLAKIGFIEFEKDPAGFRKWVEELGGFPQTWTDQNGDSRPYDQDTINVILSQLSAYTGNLSWGPSRNSMEDDFPSEYLEAWLSMPEAVRNAVEQSTERWWENYENFQSGANGSYFLNHWYGTPSRMSTLAASVIPATGKTYTAMSPKEFFANCYSEFYRDPAGYIDPKKWGGNLPSSIKKFFFQNLMDHQPYKEKNKKKGNGKSEKEKKKEPPKPTGMSGTP